MKSFYRFAIVISRFNEEVTTRLLEGASSALKALKIEDTPVYWVPGAFEIPLTAKSLAKTGRYDAILTLGAVIRGETAHFQYVCEPLAQGLMQVSLETGLPILFGVLTTEDEKQAFARSMPDSTNKGYEIVLAAVEMVDRLKDIHQSVERV